MSDARLVMLTVPCNRCGARENVWCMTLTGRRATFLHSARWRTAVERGLLPIGGDPPWSG